jgi:hypothetical protein
MPWKKDSAAVSETPVTLTLGDGALVDGVVDRRGGTRLTNVKTTIPIQTIGYPDRELG